MKYDIYLIDYYDEEDSYKHINLLRNKQVINIQINNIDNYKYNVIINEGIHYGTVFYKKSMSKNLIASDIEIDDKIISIIEVDQNLFADLILKIVEEILQQKDGKI